jgi:hypothetical protein
LAPFFRSRGPRRDAKAAGAERRANEATALGPTAVCERARAPGATGLKHLLDCLVGRFLARWAFKRWRGRGLTLERGLSQVAPAPSILVPPNGAQGYRAPKGASRGEMPRSTSGRMPHEQLAAHRALAAPRCRPVSRAGRGRPSQGAWAGAALRLRADAPSAHSRIGCRESGSCPSVVFPGESPIARPSNIPSTRSNGTMPSRDGAPSAATAPEGTRSCPCAISSSSIGFGAQASSINRYTMPRKGRRPSSAP